MGPGLALNFGGDAKFANLVIPLTGKGKYSFRAVHKIVPEMYVKHGDEDRWIPNVHSIDSGYAPEALAPNWIGTLTSNEITVEITDRRD